MSWQPGEWRVVGKAVQTKKRVWTSLYSIVLLPTNDQRDGAVGGSRTHTPLRALDFESSASASSATTAHVLTETAWLTWQ